MASTAIAPLLRDGQRDLRVLAAFPQAAYLSVGDDLVSLVTSDGIRHPNAVILNLKSTVRPLARILVGQTGRIGDGGVRLGDLEIRVSRWWDPTPRLRATTPVELRAASGVTRKRVEVSSVEMSPRGGIGLDVDLRDMLAGALIGMLEALAVGDDVAAFAVARGSIGLGPGLTPSGDDQLAGLIAGTLVLAPSLRAGAAGAGPRGGVADLAVGAAVVAATQRLGLAVAEAAVGRTTSVSAALLRHAAQGQLAGPAIELVRSWTCSAGLRVTSLPAQAQDRTRNTRNVRNTGTTRDADIVRATDQLLAVGSSSGRDLTLGLLAAVDLLTGVHGGSTRPAPITFPPPTSPRTHLVNRTS